MSFRKRLGERGHVVSEYAKEKKENIKKDLFCTIRDILSRRIFSIFRKQQTFAACLSSLLFLSLSYHFLFLSLSYLLTSVSFNLNVDRFSSIKRKNARCITSSIYKCLSRDKTRSGQKGIKIKRLSPVKNVSSTRRRKSRQKLLNSSASPCNSPIVECVLENSEVARIKPSTHEEHRISRKRLLTTKRIR